MSKHDSHILRSLIQGPGSSIVHILQSKIIPLTSLVAQGTVSLFSWVGTILIVQFMELYMPPNDTYRIGTIVGQKGVKSYQNSTLSFSLKPFFFNDNRIYYLVNQPVITISHLDLFFCFFVILFFIKCIQDFILSNLNSPIDSVN